MRESVFRVRVTATALLLALFLVSCGGDRLLERATPESVGLSSERLRRVDAAMQRAVDEGRIPGAVTLVARRGRIAHLNAVGFLDKERQAPMTTDAIFRIASMTKAVTSVAIMMLVEDGRLLLGDPVSTFIPAFRHTKVRGATALDAVPASREITIRDLLTHTAGISYGAGPLESVYREHDLYLWYLADKDEPIGVTMERLAALPFEAQPGERWVYGFATDVLGVVVERASGLTLDEFFRTRIFEPLRMTDTFFYLPAGSEARLATVYSVSSEGTLIRAPARGMGQGEYVAGPRKSFSGGAGLLSTATDYARFLQMLLDGGELDGARILSPKSVELMVANHVGGMYQGGQLGFGLGFSVVEDVGRAGRHASKGEFGWGGAYYTRFWVDPAEQVVALFMSQVLPSGGPYVQDQFRTLVYQSIVESNAWPQRR